MDCLWDGLVFAACPTLYPSLHAVGRQLIRTLNTGLLLVVFFETAKVGVGCLAFGGQVEDPDDVADILDHAFDNAGINWLDTSETFP